jgi:hypothetical protein
VALVGDRGMLTEARLRADRRPIEGLDWITARRAPAIQAWVARGAVQLSRFDQQDLAEITHPDYPGERLIVGTNPFLAEARARTRRERLAATERDLAALTDATQRARRPLRGQAPIALRVGQVLGRRQMGQHFTLAITETGFRATRDEAAIARKARDASMSCTPVSPRPGSRRPRPCAAISGSPRSAFRRLKTGDLKVRPIHHRTADRVRALVFQSPGVLGLSQERGPPPRDSDAVSAEDRLE